MSYIKCLELAGATVEMERSFGSYQGDWWARVEYKGVRGWVHGSYGSCSGCDSFEAEFGSTESECEEHRWKEAPPIPCGKCTEARLIKDRRMALFGEGYLSDLMTQEEAEKQAGRNGEFWSDEDREAFEFVKVNPV